MFEYKEFNYNKNVYKFCFNPRDPSGNGCLREIVKNNEYLLDSDDFNNKIGVNFLDIGANCGVVTIILAKQNPSSFIYSYEPHPPTFRLLEENVKINGLTNVKIFNIAVADSKTTHLNLAVHPDYSGGCTTVADNEKFGCYFRRTTEVISVEAVSLDKIISQFDLTEIYLLKIDCEGAEYGILYDSEHFGKGIVKNIVGEYHNLRYNNADNDIGKLMSYTKMNVKGLVKMTLLTL